MKKLLNLALCSAIVLCTSTVIAQNPDRNNPMICGEVNKNVISDSIVESVNINETTKQPQAAQTGGHMSLKKAQHAIVTNKLIIGEKNNDDNFRLQHYAKLDIQSEAEFTVYENCTLKIQIDGKLNNRGKLILQSGANLISPLIDMENDFRKTRNGKKILKHGIDNEGGIIIVDKDSRIYWQEREGANKTTATIHKGTIDFSKLFEEPGEYPPKDDFIMNLEGVTIKLFDDPDSTNINGCALKDVKTFQNIQIGDGCTLDGTFDFTPAKSSVIKLRNDLQKMNLSQYTVVRKKGKDSKFSENILRNLFKNGDKLIINSKSGAEQIEYSLQNLLDEFNKSKEKTILNTEYTTRVSNSSRYLKELTNDWSETIDKGILPLSSEKFTENNGWKNYDIHFRFDGNRSISFELQGADNQTDISQYQLSLYGDFSKYNALLNDNLFNNSGNMINNFVQMYNGLSPYLKTNKDTRYVVLSNEATLRLARNDEENTPVKYAALNYMQVGLEKENGDSSLEFDYSYENGVANYAQTIAIGMMKMCNKNSKFVVHAGQHVIFGSTDSKDIKISEEDEFEEEDYSLEENANQEEENQSGPYGNESSSNDGVQLNNENLNNNGNSHCGKPHHYNKPKCNTRKDNTNNTTGNENNYSDSDVIGKSMYVDVPDSVNLMSNVNMNKIGAKKYTLSKNNVIELINNPIKNENKTTTNLQANAISIKTIIDDINKDNNKYSEKYSDYNDKYLDYLDTRKSKLRNNNVIDNSIQNEKKAVQTNVISIKTIDDKGDVDEDFDYDE